jgi:hypothetical protein
MAYVSILQCTVIPTSGAAAIVVFGQLASNGETVVGLLRDKSEESHHIRVGESRPSAPGFYLMVFVNVPEGDYVIEIYDSPGLLLTWKDCEVDCAAVLATLQKKRFGEGELSFHIYDTGILNPVADGATVYQSFAASGTATAPNNPTGTMTPVGGGIAINGTNPTNSYGIWTLQFTVVKCSPPLYNLAVNVPGSGPANRSNLTVITTPSNT